MASGASPERPLKIGGRKSSFTALQELGDLVFLLKIFTFLLSS